MKNIVKYAVGVAVLSLASGAQAGSTSTDIAITALVSPTCNFANVFNTPLDLSTQILADGSVVTPAFVAATAAVDGWADLTDGPIVCSVVPTSTTLNMVSANGGIKSGSTVLAYTVKGIFAKDSTPADITIAPFNSAIGPSSDLLVGAGVSPVGTPDLWLYLDNQTMGAAVAGNYADTLTVVVATSP